MNEDVCVCVYVCVTSIGCVVVERFSLPYLQILNLGTSYATRTQRGANFILGTKTPQNVTVVAGFISPASASGLRGCVVAPRQKTLNEDRPENTK